MSELTPIPRDQRKIDVSHLEILSIFHFVGAGLAILGIGFLFLHYTILHTVFTDPHIWQNQKHPVTPPPPEFFAIFKVMYLVLGAWFIASAVLNVMSGIFLRAQKHRTFSLIVAGINCVHVPLGTVLGIFTIIVLVRDSVRELYEAKAASAVS